MPKKIERDEEFEEEEEDEDDEEDEEEEEERRPPKRKFPRMPKPQPQQPKRRYAWVVQQQAEALIDTETQEVIATDYGQALADITERLERIENAIGVMQEG